jgi:hypothetical protein
MTRLITSPNLDGPDDVYQWLIDLHAGRSEAESLNINARLILLLLNHIGDRGAIREAIALAGQPLPRQQGPDICEPAQRRCSGEPDAPWRSPQ